MEVGKYRLLAELGRGGMADVYLASSTGMGGFQKLLVVKLAHATEDPALRQMFLDEARLSARLSHPNIVQTLEVGETGDRQYIVMEYLEGPPLHRLVRRAAAQGGVPLRMMVQILAHALSGLHYAHTLTDFDGSQLKVVHRDLTPHNLIVTLQGVTKVLDFGIAKAADSRTMTQVGFYRGKLAYMAPEQARGEQVDARADVFSAGIILAEAILRRSFWGDATPAMMSSRLVMGEVPDIEQAKVDPMLEEICAHALVADREKRTGSALEFKEALEFYLSATGGPISPEEISAFVNPLVAEDRKRIRAIIDQQLQSSSSGSASAATLPSLERTGTAGTPRHGSASMAFVTPSGAGRAAISATPALGGDAAHAVLSGEGLGSTEPELPKIGGTPGNAARVSSGHTPAGASGSDLPIVTGTPAGKTPMSAAKADFAVSAEAPRRTGLYVGVGLGVVALLAVLAFAVGGRDSAAPDKATGTAPRVADPIAAPPQATHVNLQVAVEPATATLLLDGKAVPNPYVGSALRDDQSHSLVASADGYETSTTPLTYDRDVLLRLALKPLPAAAPPPPVERDREPEPARAKPTSRPAAARSRRAPAKEPELAKPEPTPPAPEPKVTPAAPAQTTDKKRALDQDVFDETKKVIDRDNPWEK